VIQDGEVMGHDEMPRTPDEEEPCGEVYSRDVQVEVSRAEESAVFADEDLARSEVAERAAAVVAAVAAVERTGLGRSLA